MGIGDLFGIDPETQREIERMASMPIQYPDQQPREHKGIFGIKGTARDILGTIGDALLIQGGAKPIYAPARQQEKLSDAMQGFAADPLSAIQRLSQVDPDAAQTLWKAHLEEQRKQSEANASIAKDQMSTAETSDKRQDNLIDRAASLLRSGNETTYPKVKQLVEALASSRGVELPWQIPDQYDKDWIESVFSSGISPEEQTKLDDTQAYREAQIAMQRGRLANATARTKQAAARLKVDAADMNADNMRLLAKDAKGNKSSTSKVTVVPPPGKPRAGQVMHNKANGTIWKEQNGEWVRAK